MGGGHSILGGNKPRLVVTEFTNQSLKINLFNNLKTQRSGFKETNLIVSPECFIFSNILERIATWLMVFVCGQGEDSSWASYHHAIQTCSCFLKYSTNSFFLFFSFKCRKILQKTVPWSRRWMLIEIAILWNC